MVLKDNQSNGAILLIPFLISPGQIQRELSSSISTHLLHHIKSPLNSIGMPYYNTLLLSSWTPQFLPRSGILSPPPPKIPPQVLSTMKMNDNIAYAALPKELRGRRNRVPVTATKDQGRFRSGKGRRDDVSAIVCSLSRRK
jgi:hypothetical protein